MTAERLGQILNDISERMNYREHTRAEYREVISLLADECCELRRELAYIENRSALALLTAESKRNQGTK